MSKKTTALITVELVERINRLKRKPDTSLTVIEEAITLLEKKRNVKCL